MIKKFTLTLSILMCASCGKVEAARTPWTITRDGLKITAGSVLALFGINMIANSVSAENRKKLKEDFYKAREEMRKIVKSNGGDLALFDEETKMLESAVTIGAPVVAGVFGGCIAVGGIYLAWRGIDGFRNSGPVE